MSKRRAELKPRTESVPRIDSSDHDELRALGYAGSEDTIEASCEKERLFLDGGVWPDQ
jgi:hypothetical protein